MEHLKFLALIMEEDYERSHDISSKDYIYVLAKNVV